MTGPGNRLIASGDSDSAVRRGWKLPKRGNIYEFGEWRALPLEPIWPGFAINTVFYAAVLWMIFAAPFALRERRRIKRGLCPKCAYPVGTNEVCTECGGAVVKQRAETQKAEIA